MWEKPQVAFVATIKKEALKFSAAHMTVFPDGTKESLHGHNFRTEIQIGYKKAGLKEMIPFHEIKKHIKAICEKWDEKLLLANDCPYLKNLTKSKKTLSFDLCGKSYSIPEDEVVLLNCDNITTENLAQMFCVGLIESLDLSFLKKAQAQWISVKIEEILGQGATYVHEFKK